MPRWIPWSALVVAFLPAIASLCAFFAAGEMPLDRAPLVAAGLFVASLARCREPRGPGHLDGAPVLAAACALELVGIATGSWSLAHLALPLGIVGMARLLGWPPLRQAALALFAVPLPFFLTASLSPQLEGGLASAACGVASRVGLSVHATPWTIEGPAGRLDLSPADGGLPLAHMLFAIGWFWRAQGRASLLSCAAGALAAATIALPLQLAAMIGAAVATGAGTPALAELLLRQALWPAVALAALALVARRRAPSRPSDGL